MKAPARKSCGRRRSDRGPTYPYQFGQKGGEGSDTTLSASLVLSAHASACFPHISSAAFRSGRKALRWYTRPTSDSPPAAVWFNSLSATCGENPAPASQVTQVRRKSCSRHPASEGGVSAPQLPPIDPVSLCGGGQPIHGLAEP